MPLKTIYFGFLDHDDTFWVMVMMKNEADLAWSIKVDQIFQPNLIPPILMMRMKLTKSNYAGVNSREDAHTDHEKSEADNAPETSLGVTYIQLILILIMQHVEKVCPKRVYLTKYHTIP